MTSHEILRIGFDHAFLIAIFDDFELKYDN